MVADDAVMFHDGAGIDDAIAPNPRSGIDHRIRHHDRAFADTGGIRNNGRRVDNGGWGQAGFGGLYKTCRTGPVVSDGDHKRRASGDSREPVIIQDDDVSGVGGGTIENDSPVSAGTPDVQPGGYLCNSFGLHDRTIYRSPRVLHMRFSTTS